ncbi:MAG: nicotinate-nucleotide adenylyltransferase [Firmicutes bacterium]|nr:nicotinate-nucleotide adenylyltransferase [Bacillota bacterium]MDD3297852.1 nicotinate-nucleotide adenylyltransferase [Bacillota bacterium]MDD3851058.1 nicotinate-nucleotide adenylyltransferase [Bacillota bacterium]MDD4706975.1 nicotinate-nucleotide adenylyltransferase [Bacillota bacterium]
MGTGKIGIMGGTFDPIHYGHLVTAEAAREKFCLDKVVFVPSGNPPHKKDKPISPGMDRANMTVLAIANNPYFEVSDIELKREGCTYTVDTLKGFIKIYDEDVQFYFITGADAVMEIFTWKDVSTILKLCRIVSAYRPGSDINKFKSMVDELERVYRSNIHMIEVPALAISSTEIRRRVREGITIKYLLPEKVEDYILKKGLYR